MAEAGIAGFLMGLSLIAAIGAQNAFVLRQGLRGEHVAAVVAVCALSDAVLIAVGIAGLGAVQKIIPGIAHVMLWGGVLFLLAYGARCFRAAMRGGEALMPASSAPAALPAVLASCLLFTWANPHVYLDTVVLLGSVGSQYVPWQVAFGLGAGLASLCFFSALGFGARLLAPVFARPGAWVVLEVIVGLTMWALAARLALGG